MNNNAVYVKMWLDHYDNSKARSGYSFYYDDKNDIYKVGYYDYSDNKIFKMIYSESKSAALICADYIIREIKQYESD